MSHETGEWDDPFGERNDVLDLSPGLTVIPVLYGSGDFAVEVRRRVRSQQFDCLAVALPPSFASGVEAGIDQLPQVSVVLQSELAPGPTYTGSGYNFVPIDPCQPIVAAIRDAMDRGIERAYVDQETDAYEPHGLSLPDPFALKKVSLERFVAALVPALPPPMVDGQRAGRIRRMAYELHRLELDYERILYICSVADWPWIRMAYRDRAPYPQHESAAGLPVRERVAEDHLYFVLGELPFITYLYEHRRAELMADESLSVDGVKSLVIEARDRWFEDGMTEELTPQSLRLLLQYVRNLTVMDGRLTPDLYNLALGAKQVAGDDFALTLIETAREYPPQRMPIPGATSQEDIGIGLGRVVDADGEARPCKNRLEGVPLVWRKLPLRPQPPPEERSRWQMQWDPFGQCSHPPEDRRVESFQQHVREQARLLIGQDLARTEKFTASLKDGLDIRETLRNWHTGDLFVRELPPSRGTIEVVVFLFESPADLTKFNWCSTWFAEHTEESTLCFFATPFAENMVGPGIAQAVYGGCFFLFPPRPIPDIWKDRRFEFAQSLEERLLAGAMFHSREKRVVLVSPRPPQIQWRKIARRFGKQLIFLPLKRFSHQTVHRLRHFHVLNSKEVRSYASKFIRDFR